MVAAAETMVPMGIDLAGSCKSPDIFDPAIKPELLVTFWEGNITGNTGKHDGKDLSKVVHFTLKKLENFSS
jgi:hypothetical protein